MWVRRRWLTVKPFVRRLSMKVSLYVSPVVVVSMVMFG